MAHEPQAWDGPNVHGRWVSQLTADARTVEIALTEKAARRIALALRRMQQTTMVLPREGVELADALDFLLVGDPESRAKQSLQGRIITEPAQDGPKLLRHPFSPAAGDPEHCDAPSDASPHRDCWAAEADHVPLATWSAYDTNPQLRAMRATGQTSEPGIQLGGRPFYGTPSDFSGKEDESA